VKAPEGHACLIDIATGHELARIEPQDGQVGGMTFTPDGTRLLEVCEAGLRVWDLRRIRERLAEHRLDWAGPPCPPGPEKRPRLPGAALGNLQGGELMGNTTRRQEHDRSVTLLRLAGDPFDPQANLDHGRWLREQNHPTEALPYLHLALLSWPTSYEVHLNQGLCRMRLGRAAEAIADFTAAAQARPDYSQPRLERARAWMQLGRYTEAADELTALLKRFAADPELYSLRASCYVALGNEAKAAADRQEAAKCLPAAAGELYNRAWVLLLGPPGERDPKRALELARKPVEVQADNRANLNLLGIALYRNGRCAEAVPLLEKSYEVGKGTWDGWSLYWLAMCHARLGNAVKARNYFDQAVKWTEEKKDLTEDSREELQKYRDEAAEVLGIARPSK
jgi:tetratricopeptide (TPR) repeat protein